MKLLDRLRAVSMGRPHPLEYTPCCAIWMKFTAVWETILVCLTPIGFVGWYILVLHLALPEEASILYLTHTLITVTFLFIFVSYAARRLFPNHNVPSSSNMLFLVAGSTLSIASLAAMLSLRNAVMHRMTLELLDGKTRNVNQRLAEFTGFVLSLAYVSVTTGRWINSILERLHAQNQLGQHQDESSALTEVYQQELLQIRSARYGLSHKGQRKRVSSPTRAMCQHSPFIYHPRKKLPKGKALPQPDHEREERRAFPYFLRCSCCIDAAPIHVADVEPTTGGRYSSGREQHEDWNINRTSFLQKPPTCHLGGFPVGDSLDLHRLCSVCKNLCASSRILNFLGQSSFCHHFRLQLRDVENLVHHDTPQTLRQAVEHGCHLCTLFWNCMNEDQQRVLLEGDHKIQLELENELDLARGRHDEVDIRRRYQARRCVTIVVESLAVHPLDKPDLPTDFSMALKHSLLVTPYAQLIPHFGNMKRPRRWKKSIRDFEHIAYDGESEFTNPIYVVPAIPAGRSLINLTLIGGKIDVLLQIQKVL